MPKKTTKKNNKSLPKSRLLVLKQNIHFLLIGLGLLVLILTQIGSFIQNQSIINAQEEIIEEQLVECVANRMQVVNEKKLNNTLSSITDLIDNERSIKKANPIRLDIPKINMGLPIEEGSIVNEQWIVSDYIANHLDISKDPGENGNIIIYGHNHQSILGNITNLNIGDEISILTEDGQTYRYIVELTDTVAPNDLTYIMPTRNEVLTIYTCTDFEGSERFFVRAERV